LHAVDEVVADYRRAHNLDDSAHAVILEQPAGCEKPMCTPAHGVAPVETRQPLSGDIASFAGQAVG
jgi:hypothetical protein